MFTYLTTHLRVPKACVDADRLRSELHIINKAVEKSAMFQRTTGLPFVDLWEEEGAHFIVPRGYPVPYVGEQPQLWNDQDEPAFPTSQLGFRRKLRENQKAPALALLQARGRDKMLCLGCGKGKTTLALWYAAQVRAKTLIIVDRDFLADQWMKEIKSIFWLPRGEIGRIQGTVHSVGEHFTVAMAHTLSQKPQPDEFFAQFGLVIVDECHVMAAPTFRALVPRFECERLGLTATPERQDGLDPVFRYHLGGMVPVYTDIERDRTASWYFKQLPRIVSHDDEDRCMQRVRGQYGRDGKPMYALLRSRYDTMACNSQEWFLMLISDIRKAADKGRNLLVLGGRKKHLNDLAHALSDMGVNCGVVTSEVNQERREVVFKECQIILATWQLASRALDIPRLDTLFLLFPSTDEGFLRQAVGRIDREYEGRRDPLVVVYDHSFIKSLKRKGEEMRGLLKQIDSKAIIRVVRN